VLVSVGLSLSATLALFEWANSTAPISFSTGRALPAGVSPLAIQPRVTASEDPLLVRTANTRAPRWSGALALGVLLLVAGAGRTAASDEKGSRRHASLASALSRAPPRPALPIL
jgi:hypothetical protein